MIISVETIKTFIKIIIILFPVFMLLYYKKGNGKNVVDYITAAFLYFVCSIVLLFDGAFMMIGIELVKSKQFFGILFIIFSINLLYQTIKGGLSVFNIKLPTFSLLSKLRNINFQVIILGILMLVFFFFAVQLGIAIFTTKEVFFEKLPLIVSEILLISVVIVLGIIWINSFGSEADRMKKLMDISLKSFYVFFPVFGLLAIAIGVKNIFNFNKDFIKTKGTYEYKELYRSSSSDKKVYELTYSYVVDGETYFVTTDYGTSTIPKEGSTVNVYYNPKDPSDAEIKGEKTNYFVIILGLAFGIAPFIILPKNKKNYKT